MRKEWENAKTALRPYEGMEGLYEIDLETTAHKGVMLRDGKRVSVRLDEMTGAYVRAGRNHLGSSVQEGSPFDFKTMLEEAETIGMILDGESQETIQIPYAAGCSCFTKERDLYSLQELTDIGRMVLSKVKEGLTEVPALNMENENPDFSLYIGERIHEEAVYNNHGLSAEDLSSSLEICLHAFGQEYLTMAKDKDSIDLSEWMDRMWIDAQICELEKEDSSYISFEGSKGEAVLGSGVMCNWLITAWKHFTATSVTAGNTCLAGELGKQIAAKCVSLKDVPSVRDAGFIRRVDAEGSAAGEITLIDEGKLCGWMSTCKSADRTDGAKAGCAGRTATLVKSTAIQVVPRNTVFMPGESSLRKLLHREDEKESLYIYEAFDQFHALDIATGDFHFPCKGAIVKNGRVLSLIDRVTLEGNSRELLMSISDIGSQIRQQPLVIMETYMVAAPAVRVCEIRVSGNNK